MTAKVQIILDYLDAIRSIPIMHFGSDDAPQVAQAHLSGVRGMAFRLLGIDPDFVSIMDEAAIRRGYWYHADGIIPALRRKGLDDKQVVAELIESEIEFWKVYAERSAK